MKKIKYLMLSLMLSIFFVLASAASDESKPSDKVNSATKVLQEFYHMKESIPRNLIAEYQGIIVVPHLINVGLGLGAKRGKGIAVVKLGPGKWSDPVFVTLTGGSIGAQIGVQSTDLVLVFRHKGVLTKVKNGDVTIGGDIAAAAGPYGRSTSANTDYKLDAEVYSYSRSKGLFAGVSLNGTSVAIDKSENRKYYGRDVTSNEIFESSVSTKPAVIGLKSVLKSMQ